MVRRREFFLERVGSDGEIIVRGQFWELKEDGKKHPRMDLCLKKEVVFKQTVKNKVKRTETEQTNYLAKLYNEKLAELSVEVTKKKTIEDERRLVSRIMQDWLDYVGEKGSIETRKIYVTTVKYYLSAVGDHLIDDYDYKKYLKFLQFLKKKPNRMGGMLSDVKIRGHFRQLRTFNNWAFKHRILDRAFYIELPAETKKEQRPYRTDELLVLRQTIIESIREATRKNHRICRINDLRAFIILSYTGMRRGAIWSLMLENIDLDQRIIKVRRNEELGWNNKKLKDRDKPISNNLLKYLERDLADRNEQERYFLDNGNGGQCYRTAGALTKAFARHRNDAGLPVDIKPIKAIRNHGVNMLLEKGLSMKIAQQFIDHESIVTTDGYANSARFRIPIKNAAELVEIGWEDELFE